MRIHYHTPYATDLNIGRAYNEACASAGPDDWLCLRDGDTMFLQPDWGKQIAAIVDQYSDYDLVGCVTNRLASINQLHEKQFSDNPDILHHKAIADQLYEKYCNLVKPFTGVVAGMFLLFPRKTWEKHLFKENDIRFDVHFSRGIMAAGGKIGLAQGLYVFHMYRLGQPNPKRAYQHLTK